MKVETLNINRSNIKYQLYCLFLILEERKVERKFIKESFTIEYSPAKGMTLNGRNPIISVDQDGVELPLEYTSVFQLPYEWIKMIIKDLSKTKN